MLYIEIGPINENPIVDIIPLINIQLGTTLEY